MGESQKHLDLVQLIAQYVAWRLRAWPAVAIFADLPTTPRREKPPRVGGFVPDVFAVNVPTTIQVIGEAKTEWDLELAHTRLQLGAFGRHLSVRGGLLVVAVPTTATATARRFVRELFDAMGLNGVETAILDEASQWH